MRIIRSTETIPVQHPVFLLFGQPGIGKSSLGYSMRDPLTLDFDHGAHRAANRRDTLLIDTWADVVDLNADILEPYSSIVIDTVGRCLDVLTVSIIEKSPKLGRDGGALTLQGYGALKAQFRTWISLLRTYGKDVLLIAHDKEDKDGDYRIVRPDIMGGSYDEVMKIADFCGYVYMAGKDRVLDFSPTEKWVGKNPGNWPPLKVPSVAKARNTMAELFDKGRAALGAISDESAKVAIAVDDWRAAIQTYTTVAELNQALADSSKQSAIVAPQVKTLLGARARELKLKWDAKQNCFAEPKTEEVPA